MKRPTEPTTKIFLDSGSAEHTRDIIAKLGWLDGQTTNPTYFVKSNPAILSAIAAGKKFSRAELLRAYRRLIDEVSALIPPDGSVSIEVYADEDTSAEQMMAQAREMWSWASNAHIKLPTNTEGLTAAEQLAKDGMRINMTLCFSQAQAAAVHAATRGAAPGQIYVSPFISRLDKIGQNGFELLLNIQKMYRAQNSHVSILAASVHSVYDIAQVIEREMDIITIPYDDFLVWLEQGTPFTTDKLPAKDASDLAGIPYEQLDLSSPWQSFAIDHELTRQGLKVFADDWNALIA